MWLTVLGVGVPALSSCGGSDGAVPAASDPVAGTAIALYRQQGCSCCTAYADYLRDNGFAVDVTTLEDLEQIRAEHAIPEEAVGCHTSVADGYVIEGHVPVEAIDRLLGERPAVDGIAVVGMPVSSPGMGRPNGDSLEVLSFRNGRVAEYLSVTTF